MFIFKLYCREGGSKHTLTSSCRFINPEIDDPPYILELKPVPVAFQFSLFFADFLKKYGNEIEIDRK